jgi:relaxase-like protein
MIARGKFVRGNPARTASHLTGHLKYLEYRSREIDETREGRYIFTKDDDHVERKDAQRDIMEHTSGSVHYHKIMLSPASDEPVEDWQQWTREVMRDLEETQGKDLHWYAVHHDNTEHPHVHVVLAGAAEDHVTGEMEPVKLYQGDYEHLRESGREYSEHGFYHQLEEDLQELDRQDTVVRDHVELPQERDTFSPLEEPGDFYDH